jgi:succinyl-CoA synthetase alpha subunit
MFLNDEETEAIIMIGEIGGSAEVDGVNFYLNSKIKKPIAGFIAGATAPKGKRMGHAGAIISGGNDTAEVKIAAMKKAGFIVAETPAHLGQAVLKAIAA